MKINKSFIVALFLHNIYTEEVKDIQYDNYLIDWGIKQFLPQWFSSKHRPFQQSTILLPLLLFNYHYNEIKGHPPLIDIRKFKRGFRLKHVCDKVCLKRVLFLIEKQGIPIVSKIRIMSYGWGINDRYKKVIVDEFKGELQLMKVLQKGPVLSELYLQGLDDYDGEIYDGRFCSKARDLNLDKETVLLTGIKKDSIGDYYYEAITSKPNSWGYNRTIKIKIIQNQKTFNEKDKYGICDIAGRFYSFSLSN